MRKTLLLLLLALTSVGSSLAPGPRPASAAGAGSFAAPGDNILGLAYGAGSLWAVNRNSNPISSTIFELNPNTGAIRNSFDDSTLATGLAHDGTFLYTTRDAGNFFCGGSNPNRIYVLNPANGAVLRSIPSPVTGGGGGLAFLNGRLFAVGALDPDPCVIGTFGVEIVEVDPADGALLNHFDVDALGIDKRELDADGTNLLYLSRSSASPTGPPDYTLYTISPDGVVGQAQSLIFPPEVNPDVNGIASDGANLYLADRSTFPVGRIFVFPLPIQPPPPPPPPTPILLLHGYLGSCWSMQALEQYLESNGYAGRVECFNPPGDGYYGYDYTDGGVDSALRLATYVWGFKQRMGLGPGDKFDIVAHSFGGLVSRYYIEKMAGHLNVGSITMLGTPNLGIQSRALHWLGAYVLGDGLVDLAISSAFLDCLNDNVGCVTGNFDASDSYRVIAGTSDSSILYPCCGLQGLALFRNDCLVRVDSAIGPSPPFALNEVDARHTEGFPFNLLCPGNTAPGLLSLGSPAFPIIRSVLSLSASGSIGAPLERLVTEAAGQGTSETVSAPIRWRRLRMASW